jgi:hypothetical protein
MSPIIALTRLIDRRIDASTIAAARIVIGLSALIGTVEVAQVLPRVLAPTTLRLPYVPGVPVLGPEAAPVLIAIWVVAALALTLGWQTRLAGSLLALTAGSVIVLDQQTYTNHQYLLALLALLLAIGDSGARWSLDARRDGGRATVAAWPVFLLRCQLTIVYGFTALAKINPLYISGSIIVSVLRLDGWLAVPAAWHRVEVMSTFALLSILTEVVLALAFWSPRLRLPAVVVGVGFHALIVLWMDLPLALTMFALEMFGLYLAFFDLTPLRRWWAAHQPRLLLVRALPRPGRN